MQILLAAVVIDAFVMLISIASALGICAVLLVGLGSFVSVDSSNQSIPQRKVQEGSAPLSEM